MARARAKRRSFGKLRQLPSGRWQASYLDPAGSGVRYTAPHTFDAKIDAEGWLSGERRLIELGGWKPPSERAETKAAALVKFRDFADQWLAERSLTPKTKALYRDLLDSRILPVLGDEYLTDLTPALIRTWHAGLGSKTPTRTAHSYQVLRTILNTAVDDGLIAENPAKIKSAGRPPKRRKLEILTPAELEAVAAAITPPNYRAAVLLAAWGALRFGELIELRRKDVVKANGVTVLRVRRAAVLVDGKIIVGTPKTDAGTRDVVLPPHVAEILDEHLKKYAGRGPENLVFRTTRGTRLSQSAFTKAFKDALPAGKNVRVHDLRHTGAVLAAQSGATTRELMDRLGHTTPTQAMRYQHAAEGRDAELAAAMSRLAGGSGDTPRS